MPAAVPNVLRCIETKRLFISQSKPRDEDEHSSVHTHRASLIICLLININILSVYIINTYLNLFTE